MPNGVPTYYSNSGYTPVNWPTPDGIPLLTADQLTAPAVNTAALTALPSISAPPMSMWDRFTSAWDNSGMLGKTIPDGTKVQGWGGLALGVGQGLMNSWLGMKQYGLAKDTLEQNKKQFQLNYDAQKQAMNNQLEDRQRARVASNPTAYQSVGDYMKQHGIGG